MASPTIPRLNDQGNYYNDQLYMQQQQGYDQYHDGNGGYYYPQDGSAAGGYYDENGYYYDNSAMHSNAGGYDPMSPPQQNYHTNMNMMGNNAPLPPLPNTTNEVYKPDSIK